jgi:hypothetical protein
MESSGWLGCRGMIEDDPGERTLAADPAQDLKLL